MILNKPKLIGHYNILYIFQNTHIYIKGNMILYILYIAINFIIKIFLVMGTPVRNCKMRTNELP